MGPIARTAVFTTMLALSAVARADVWDVQTNNDNSPSTQNELVNGTEQLHDLGTLSPPGPDQDWFRLSQRPYSSYEVLVDSTSGDFGGPLVVNRTDDTGATVFQNAQAVGVGFSRSLRWVNDTASTVDTNRIVVTSPSCATFCGADDVYRIRFYDTSYAIPRFNNSGSQVTILIIQNPNNYTVIGSARYWSTAGALIGTTPFNLPPKNTLVLNTSSVVPGVAGAITVASDARYGELAGKTVALEPSTGFSFDTPMVPRMR